MKLRSKGNSLRIRLSKPEVTALGSDGCLEERIKFPKGVFSYILLSSAEVKTLSASIANNQITMYVPHDFAKAWPDNDVVGCDALIPLKGNENLFLLLEEDFVCLDETNEDQRDNYPNPKQTHEDQIRNL